MSRSYTSSPPMACSGTALPFYLYQVVRSDLPKNIASQEQLMVKLLELKTKEKKFRGKFIRPTLILNRITYCRSCAVNVTFS
jgi:hypothetical protein